MHGLKIPPHGLLISSKGEKAKYTVEKSDHILSGDHNEYHQWTSMKALCAIRWVTLEGHNIAYTALQSKKHNLKLITRKHRQTQNQEHFFLTNKTGGSGVVLVQNASVIGDKEKLWKFSRLKEAKEIAQLSAIPDYRLGPVLKGKECYKCYWKQNWNTNGRWKYYICAKFTELIAELWLCTRISLCLRKFTVKYLAIKGYDIYNLPLNALGRER